METPIKTDPQLEALDRCPPFLVYYGFHLLQTGERPNIPELLNRSGLSLRTFTRTAHRHSWARVKVSVMTRFCNACGVNPLQPEALLARVAAEIAKPNPFPELSNHRRRNVMLRGFNVLCAQAALGKSA